MTYRYSAKKPFAIAYKVFIGICMLLTLGRWYSVLNPDFTMIHAEVHAHISNLSLSMLVYVGIGYSWLLFGIRFRFMIILGALLLVGNFVCETLMGFLNTTDLMDAIYGAAGLLAAYIYLFLTNKYGLVERSPGKE